MIRCEPVKGDKVKVTFTLPADEPEGKVAVAGDFNDWDTSATTLRKRGDKRSMPVVATRSGTARPTDRGSTTKRRTATSATTSARRTPSSICRTVLPDNTGDGASAAVAQRLRRQKRSRDRAGTRSPTSSSAIVALGTPAAGLPIPGR
jgi:hypothetical protein